MTRPTVLINFAISADGKISTVNKDPAHFTSTRDLQRLLKIRGRADGEATRIYAAAYNRDDDFYAFIKSLETYELTADPSSILILTTDSELLRFVKSKQ